MILADKIIEERKRQGLSQEELAEKLSVSRQSISKWEGAQSVPDINRIIQMAEIFGVSTDYLLRDDMERQPEESSFNERVEVGGRLRRVSMEEASEFLSLKERHAPIKALGASLGILSPALLILLNEFAKAGIIGISVNIADAIGLTALFVMVAAAVYLFMRCGSENKKFEFLDKEEIDTEYGVDGMTREKSERFERIRSRNVAFGVVLCILGYIPLTVTSLMTKKEHIISAMVVLMLVLVATAVNMFIRAATIKGSYDRLLQEGDYTVSKKKNSSIIGRISGIYWLVALASYLAVSFYTDKWDKTWIIWAVAGILFVVVILITKIVIKAED